jgi:hypothetical protein
MKIAAVCCTYLRPEALGQMIQSYLYQDYPADRRELVILDDAGQYTPQQGEGWRLISTERRFRTLGEKRNAGAALTSPDVDVLAVWDDDDIYLPWALSASAAALRSAAWSRPSIVLHEKPEGTLTQHRTGGLFHGGWAYRRLAFLQAGGYPAMDNGEDQGLARRLQRNDISEADPCRLGFRPFYVYRWGSAAGYHLSGMGTDGYARLGRRSVERAALKVAWPRDYRQMPIRPGVRPRVF